MNREMYTSEEFARKEYMPKVRQKQTRHRRIRDPRLWQCDEDKKNNKRIRRQQRIHRRMSRHQDPLSPSGL